MSKLKPTTIEYKEFSDRSKSCDPTNWMFKEEDFVKEKGVEKTAEPIFHWDIIQGSDEWVEIRSGKMTGSVFKTFLVNGKQEEGFGTGAITELYRVMEERDTGLPRENFGSTKATQWGTNYEPEAREEYEYVNFIEVKECGFVQKGDWVGASPDGLIPSIKRGCEFKCFPSEHMRILSTGQYKEENYIQCQFNLWVTNYDSWDLSYYHPNVSEAIRLKTFTLTPDAALFDKFSSKEEKFKKLVNEKMQSLGI